jgi:hypothetical protein
MLVGERDARLGFIHGLPDQIHRSGTMAALVAVDSRSEPSASLSEDSARSILP